MHELIAKTDLCVQCGLCLAHCPTYGKTQNENESPRGRLSLIQAWANGDLPGSKKLKAHIDNCLLCRSCEKVCPALVPYGEIVDEFRNATQGNNKMAMDLTLLKKIAHHKKFNHIARRILNSYQSSGIQEIIQFLKISKLFKLDKIERLINNKQNPAPQVIDDYYPAVTIEKGDVGLFVGCMGSLLDQETIHSAIKLLTLAGFNVHIPDSQTCCGALDLHSGDKSKSTQLEHINQQVFATKEWIAIISIASGCGSQLKDYDNKEFADKTVDISQFLLDQKIIFNSVLPDNSMVVVHTPCSLKNSMQQEQGALTLVKQIPDIKIKVISQTIQCCGSAGSYMLQHPKMAELLVDDLINELISYKPIPNYCVTSNIGCVLHIRARCRERNIELEVIHPVTLLAKKLA
ncbi:MAG: (Fe-S)-binding protein [Methylococcaceae bacterium]